MKKPKTRAETPTENQPQKPKNGGKKPYPLLPYLIGLFVMVVVLVVLSYLMQLRNRQELPVSTAASIPVTETFNDCTL